MRKKTLTLLFLTTLVLSGCNGANDDNDEMFDLFNPTKTCLVNRLVKEYTDRMYAQRSDAGVLPSEENKIVSPLYADRVKIKEYLGDYDECVPLELNFVTNKAIKNDAFVVRYWPKGKENQYIDIAAHDGKVELNNLFRSTTYEWKVLSSSGKESNVEKFTTDDYVRFINCGGAFNFRDAGGWTTLNGKRIKQGLIYRGGELNDHTLPNGHEKNIFGDSDPAKKIFVDDLGIRVDIDLRTREESDGMTSSPMNTAGVTKSDPRYVEYIRPNINSYINGLNSIVTQENIKIMFEDYFANANNKPVYYHCYAGADRTGTVGFVLGAILGMTYTDLIIDYEATTFSDNLKEHDVNRENTYFPDLLAGIKNWDFYSEDMTLCEIMETYLTQKCKVSMETIEQIRSIMLEDIN